MTDEPTDLIEALLGWQRARILRGLDVARRPGQIANALFMVPAGATHHLTRLEAAGLVIRKRRGRHVVAERTARGTALLKLYAEDSEILKSIDSATGPCLGCAPSSCATDQRGGHGAERRR